MSKKIFLSLVLASLASAWACSPVAPSVSKITTQPAAGPSSAGDASRSVQIQKQTLLLIKVPVKVVHANATSDSPHVAFTDYLTLAESDLSQLKQTRSIEVSLKGTQVSDSGSVLIRADLGQGEPKLDEIAALDLSLEPIADTDSRYSLKVSEQITDKTWASIRERIQKLTLVAPIEESQAAGKVAK